MHLCCEEKISPHLIVIRNESKTHVFHKVEYMKLLNYHKIKLSIHCMMNIISSNPLKLCCHVHVTCLKLCQLPLSFSQIDTRVKGSFLKKYKRFSIVISRSWLLPLPHVCVHLKWITSTQDLNSCFRVPSNFDFVVR